MNKAKLNGRDCNRKFKLEKKPQRSQAAKGMEKSIYHFSAKTIDGKKISLSEFKGRPLLIVNVASRCGFTPQYLGLQELYQKFKGDGFEVLGFPCNQFGSQEPGKEDEIKTFCELNFGVSFPLFAKVEVNGKNAHPLFKFLSNAKPGVLKIKRIKWNFTKFLIDANGHPVKRYAPTVAPKALIKDIKKLLS